MTETNSNLKQITMKKLKDENPLVFEKVVNMLSMNRKQDFIISYLNSKGYKFSKPSLSAFKKKIIEAKEKNIPIDEILDKRRKDSVSSVPEQRVKGFTGQPSIKDDNYHEIPVTARDMPKGSRVYSVPQALETIIQKGMSTIENVDIIDSGTLLKSMDLLSKYYPENHGLTQSALDQYQLIIQAQSQAVRDVLLQYVPKEQIPEALDAMEEASHEYLDTFGATPEGRRLLDALTEAHLDI